MKKLLFSLLALVAMIGTISAQRAWAYDLGLGYASDTYTFSFKATTAANATLIFTDAEGTELATHDAGAVVAGANTVSLPKAQLPEGDAIYWAVKLTGEAIADFVEVTDDSKGIYNFYLPQGVAVDNNPESSTFGNIYVAQSTNGASDGGSTRADNQKQGIFIYDQTLAELNPTSNVGIIPSNVTLSSTTNRQAMKRIFINPVTNEVAFIHNLDPVAIWAVPANNVGGEAKNLIDGLGFTAANAACFGEDGSLYVLVSTGYPAPGSLYKITDGVVDTLFADYGKFGNADVALASDGRGGVWIAQNRGQLDGFNQLTHVNAAGEIDFEVNSTTPNGIESANTARGTMAYNPNEDVLALGIGATNTIGASLYKVTYDAETGVPSLAFLAKTPSLGKNVDGLAFDYAGDLYGLSANKERFYKYAVPTNNNVCRTPAPKAQVIVNSSSVVTYTINATANDDKMGTVTGGGVYLKDAEVILTATPADGHTFVKWSNESTENPLIFTAIEDLTISAIFEVLSYTVTLSANDATKGTVEGTGTYEYGTEVTLSATPADGYEFVDWSNGSKENPLTIAVKEDTELTANFRAVMASSITLNALPVVDYSASIVGTIKRAVQNGENTIVLSHEVDGTPHIYNVAHATKTVTEISQEGVNAAADGFLAISDIAVTEDGKLVACNYVHCTFTPSNTSYFYIWDDIAGNPKVWFTSQKSGNYNDAYMGYTMALKGTSQNAEVTIPAFNKSNSNTRYSHLYVVDGAYADANYKYSRDNAALHPNTLGRNTYELNASPLAAGKWIVDGELTSPIEFVEKNAVAIDTYTALNSNVLGKKYNGAYYLKNYNDHHFMIAPYANEEGLLAGVKVIGITDGFAAPTVLASNTDLDIAVEATTASATAIVDADGDLTIHLFADARVYTFTEKADDPTPPEVELVGVVKRALTIGESTVVLTHEADGTAHIYNIVGEEIAEVSQEGVVPVNPDNLGDYLAISDIAVTEDGKLVARNYMRVTNLNYTPDAGYERGENRFYIWNDLAGAPSVWFTSLMTSNSIRSDQGITMAVKGTSTNAKVLTTGVHNSGRGIRMSLFFIKDGKYVDPNGGAGNKGEYYWYLDSHFKSDAIYNEAAYGVLPELSASPLGENNWIMDNVGMAPSEFSEPADGGGDPIVNTVLADDVVGKKFNGATYVTIDDQVLMVAPYATAEGLLAGVKVLDITAGLASATEVAVADLDAAVEATAAATAVVVDEDKLIITLVGDATLYTLTAELTQDPGPGTALDNIAVEAKAIKMIKNGQLIIIKNGVQYNVQGAVVK